MSIQEKKFKIDLKKSQKKDKAKAKKEDEANHKKENTRQQIKDKAEEERRADYEHRRRLAEGKKTENASSEDYDTEIDEDKFLCYCCIVIIIIIGLFTIVGCRDGGTHEKSSEKYYNITCLKW